MDQVQKYVHDGIPEFTARTGIIAIVVWVIIWQIHFEMLKIIFGFVMNNF